MKTIFLAIVICFLLISNATFSRDFRVKQIPNGSKFQCLNCHTSSNGGSLNSFGTEIKNNFLTTKNATGNVIWNAALASKDSDKDGFTNGQELGDPQGLWKIGDMNPGNMMDMTNPGSASSKPTDVIENSSNQISDAIQIQSLFPNPVIDIATLQYELKYPDFVSISLYDYNGNEVKSIFNGFITSGIQNITFNINSTQSNVLIHGSYMLVIRSGINSIVAKLIIK
jgi:hypothetical protein